MIFFVSDMHFGHNNILNYCRRPWSDIPSMDEALVDNWNSTVGAADTVYHLGDWAFHNYENIGRLNGFIHSIPGNHDHERAKKILPYLPNGFTDEIMYLKVDKTYCFALCHYPIESWRREYTYHLHGHTHGTAGVHYNRLDVGIDATKLYRPISLGEVVERMNTNNLWAAEMQK